MVKYVCKHCKVEVVSKTNVRAILGRQHGKYCPRKNLIAAFLWHCERNGLPDNERVSVSVKGGDFAVHMDLSEFRRGVTQT